jgi:hypothetical protein
MFRKYSNIKFHEKRSRGAELFHADGRKDRHDEANGRFSKFSKAPKIQLCAPYLEKNSSHIKQEACQIFRAGATEEASSTRFSIDHNLQ